MPKLPLDILNELQWLKSAQKDDSVSVEEWRARGNALIEKASKLSPPLFRKFDRLFGELHEADQEEALHRWLHQELKENTPKLIQTKHGVETYQIGGIEVRVPALNPRMGITLYAAVSRRREADFTGVCACGAEGVVEHDLYTIHHDPACPASDNNLYEALHEFGLFESKEAS